MSDKALYWAANQSNISPVDLHTLHGLARLHEGPNEGISIPFEELATHLNVAPATLARRVNKLIAHNLIERHRNYVGQKRTIDTIKFNFDVVV